jgi:hypothetical protein
MGKREKKDEKVIIVPWSRWIASCIERFGCRDASSTQRNEDMK